MDLNMVICPTTLFWYVFFSILSTLIGAYGALYIEIAKEPKTETRFLASAIKVVE